MIQEDVFSEGGFAYGFALPLEQGNLAKFKIIRFHAEKRDDAQGYATK